MYTLGIDIGSTTSKCVILKERRRGYCKVPGAGRNRHKGTEAGI